MASEISPAPARHAASSARNRFLAALTGFWRWWTSELIASLPQAWMQTLSGGGRGPMLCIDGDEVVLVEPTGANLRELGRISIAGLEPDVARSAVQKLLVQHQLSGTGVKLGLDRAICLLKTIELPLAAEENLQGVLAFELDRYTPFKADAANFASRVIKRDVERGRLFVQLAVAPRIAVRALLERVRSWGVEPTAVMPEADAGRAGAPLDLMGGERAETGTGRTLDPLMLGAAAAFLLLSGVALILPVWQKREAAKALTPKLGVARQQAEDVDKLRKELENLLSEANFVLAKKHTTPPLSLMIEDLSRVFPDTTWVQVMEVKTGGKQRELILTGETASPSKLVETMEQIPYLTNPGFRSPLTKGGAPGSERFVLAAEIKSRPLPVPAPEGAGSSVPPASSAPSAPAPPPSTAPAASPAVQPATVTLPPNAVKPAAPAGAVPSTSSSAMPSSSVAPPVLAPAPKSTAAEPAKSPAPRPQPPAPPAGAKP